MDLDNLDLAVVGTPAAPVTPAAAPAVPTVTPVAPVVAPVIPGNDLDGLDLGANPVAPAVPATPAPVTSAVLQGVVMNTKLDANGDFLFAEILHKGGTVRLHNSCVPKGAQFKNGQLVSFETNDFVTSKGQAIPTAVNVAVLADTCLAHSLIKTIGKKLESLPKVKVIAGVEDLLPELITNGALSAGVTDTTAVQAVVTNTLKAYGAPTFCTEDGYIVFIQK